MRIRHTAILAALVVAFVLAPPAAADDVHDQMIEKQSGSVVALKYVLSVRITAGGRSQDSERSGTAVGVMVDPVGLVVVPSRVLVPKMRFTGVEMSSTPTSLRVIFPGDPKEYDAVLGATDSRLGLSFVRIKDLEGKEVQSVDLSRTADPRVGMRAYGVSRLSQGFDYAPYCDVVDLAGFVKKPRKMWLLRGRFTQVAHPVFDPDGAVLGFVSVQEGVGDGGSLPFLLPLKVIQSTISRAAREAERVLEEVLEREAEEGANGKDEPEEGSGDEEGTEEPAPPSDEDGEEPPAPPETPPSDEPDAK